MGVTKDETKGLELLRDSCGKKNAWACTQLKKLKK
jgi:hypothetical protein